MYGLSFAGAQFLDKEFFSLTLFIWPAMPRDLWSGQNKKIVREKKNGGPPNSLGTRICWHPAIFFSYIYIYIARKLAHWSAIKWTVTKFIRSFDWSWPVISSSLILFSSRYAVIRPQEQLMIGRMEEKRREELSKYLTLKRCSGAAKRLPNSQNDGPLKWLWSHSPLMALIMRSLLFLSFYRDPGWLFLLFVST